MTKIEVGKRYRFAVKPNINKTLISEQLLLANGYYIEIHFDIFAGRGYFKEISFHSQFDIKSRFVIGKVEMKRINQSIFSETEIGIITLSDVKFVI
jgi:hypothetical protein